MIEKIRKQFGLGNEAGRFIRFLLVGAAGTALDFGALTLLKLAGLPTLPANTLSFSLGVANNFYWNRRWTFGDLHREDWTRQLAQFALVSGIGLALNNAIVLLLEGAFAGWLGDWAYLPAKTIATGLVVFWNFSANRLWTFRPVAEEI